MKQLAVIVVCALLADGLHAQLRDRLTVGVSDGAPHNLQQFKIAPMVVQKTPVYRYYNGKDHFYSTYYGEIGTATRGQLGKHGYTSEAAAFQSVATGSPGFGIRVVPVYRYWNGVEHHYTTNDEIGTKVAGQVGHHGYRCEGVAFWAFDNPNPAPRVRTAPVYRYWNGVEHFFTRDPNEIGTTTHGQTGRGGYKCEGIAWYVPA